MRRTLTLLLGLLAGAFPARAQQQVDDTGYLPRVADPAFRQRHPVVLVDAAHHDAFTADGQYRGLAALLRADGLGVESGRQPVSPALLKTCEVLVVADASPTDDVMSAFARAPAFRRTECDAVRDWVREGGGLLLIADHSPFASAMDSLATRFGVDMGKGMTVDARRVDKEIGNPGCILFTRDFDGIGDHPITRGRNGAERIRRVATFTGQSLQGPPGSTALLVLGPSSSDLPTSPDARRVADPRALRLADTTSSVKTAGAIPAVGRSQALAFRYGKGRVVVLGDAAMFGAQFVTGIPAKRMGRDSLRIGMNRPDLDNQQLALNVVRWLARAL